MVINVVEVTQNNIKEWISSGDVCLVDIWAPWCGPCKQLSPIIDEVSSEMVGKCLIGKLEADSNMDFCKEVSVRNIPTILIYKSGEIVERMTGLKSKKEIISTIEKYL